MHTCLPWRSGSPALVLRPLPSMKGLDSRHTQKIYGSDSPRFHPVQVLLFKYLAVHSNDLTGPQKYSGSSVLQRDPELSLLPPAKLEGYAYCGHVTEPDPPSICCQNSCSVPLTCQWSASAQDPALRASGFSESWDK